MSSAKNKDEEQPTKVGRTRVSLSCFTLIPFEPPRDESPLSSSKVIEFHIMEDPIDRQPTIVQREHRLINAILYQCI